MKNRTKWIEVKGFDKYEVSNGGHVRNKKSGQWLKPFPNEKNYLCVMIINNEGISKKRKLHRLVAIAHVPNPDNLPEVNHMFGNKWDCRACVLEWQTRQQNVTHAWNTGLCDHLKGKRKIKNNGRSKTKQRHDACRTGVQKQSKERTGSSPPG